MRARISVSAPLAQVRSSVFLSFSPSFDALKTCVMNRNARFIGRERFERPIVFGWRISIVERCTFKERETGPALESARNKGASWPIGRSANSCSAVALAKRRASNNQTARQTPAFNGSLVPALRQRGAQSRSTAALTTS